MNTNFKIGQKVVVPETTNKAWAGKAKVVSFSRHSPFVLVKMLTGEFTGEEGGFLPQELVPIKASIKTYAQGFKDAKRAIRRAINKKFIPGPEYTRELDALFLSVQPKENK